MTDKYFPLYIFVFTFSLLITVTLEKKLIPMLSARAKQPIYTDGPRWHIKKSGTPTMGGIAFFGAFIAVSLASSAIIARTSQSSAYSLLLSLAYAISNGLIGVLDDSRKLKHKENMGLRPKEKLLLQFIFAVLFLILRKILLNDTSELYFSFGTVDLGIFYYPLSLLTLLAIVNFANLTDGIDGLASSVSFAVGVSLFYISFGTSRDSAILASALIGMSVGFLVFNLHPAKIFMGDTGSLFLGSLIGASAFSLKNLVVIIFIAGVFVLEGLSVVIQVVCYKLTKKRVFRMAPLHHHLEKCGWSENRICIVAMIATFVFSIPAYLLCV